MPELTCHTQLQTAPLRRDHPARVAVKRPLPPLTTADDECVIYDETTIETLDRSSIWNLTGPQIAYLQGLIKNGPQRYIANAPHGAAQRLIVYRGCALPFTVVSQEERVFCVSPKTCWFDYPRLLYRNSAGRARAPVLNFLLGLARRLARFEKTVTLNNWWLTNNPTPAFSRAHIRAFTDRLTALYPEHLIVLKSLPETDPTGVLETVQAEGYTLVKFRFMHFREPTAKRTKAFRYDQKLLKTTALTTRYLDRVSGTQAEQCAALYRKLYIGKHTDMNTAFNRHWMALTCNTGFLNFFVIEDADEIKGFVVSYPDANGINVGTCGYDLSIPQEVGLYRMIVGSTFRKGFDEGKCVNLSTSVPDFKRRRGCHRVIEYEAVYADHLPFLTRAFLRVFAALYNSRTMDKMRCA
ncbi:MAG: hypothetical protein AAFX54_03260 [Pseudomonadota bacterium]